MKKVLITMAMLTGMVAGGMVLSSFAVPKTNDKTVCSQIDMNDGWTRIGSFRGRWDGPRLYDEKSFIIWEKSGMCNSYYWTLNYDECKGNPDVTECESGALRKDDDGRWYASCDNRRYYIKDF